MAASSELRGGIAQGVVLLALLPACVSTLAHPLRATSGAFSEVSATWAIAGGRQVGCSGVCAPIDGRPNGPQLPSVTVGYGRVFGRRFGVMGGLTAPVRGEFGAGPPTASLALFGFFTVQGRYGSLGAGPNVRFSSAGLTLGAEAQPWGQRGARPRLGVYARWYFPFRPTEPERTRAGEVGGLQPERELGVRLSVWRVFAQYTLFTQERGLLTLPTVVEGRGFTEVMHGVTVGFAVSPADLASWFARGRGP